MFDTPYAEVKENETLIVHNPDDFDLQLQEQKLCHRHLINDLSSCIENDELELFYQPQVDLKAGKTRSVEALIRWHHPLAGMIPPDLFIPLAERSGYIHELTDWVLNQALQQLHYWKIEGIEISMAVNLSAHSLDDHRLPNKVTSLLEKWSIPPQQLILEVTEGVLIEDPDHAIVILTQLSESGIRLSLDDFGTGFSSLSYLSSLPINELKIDKSLIMNMETNKKNKTIVQSTIDLARNLGLSIVAEGVENIEALSKLINFKCDTAQGYYFSKPVCGRDFTLWLYDSNWGMTLDVCYAN